MVKKVLVSLIFILIAAPLLCAEPDEEKEGKREQAREETAQKPKLGFNMNINMGLSSYENALGNNIAFQRFSFIPEFTYGKWGLGINFTFEFDGDFKLRDLDNDGKADGWSKFSDYLYKIYYLRYGQKGEPIYGRIGAFDTYTLGHGLIMDRFSNTLFYPQVLQLGLNLDIDGEVVGLPIVGFESVVDDVLDWDIMGFRLYARPLTSLSTPIIKDIKVGASIVADLDPQEMPLSNDYGPPKDNPDSDGVSILGIDTEVPIFERGQSSLIAYADWATITGKGNGSIIGTTYRYAWFKLFGQLRFLGEQFTVGYFDPFYEVERALKYDSLDAVTEFYMGYLAGTDLSLFNFAYLFFFYSDGFNDDPGPRIQTGIGTQEGALAKFDVGLSYDKKDIQGFKDFFKLEGGLFRLQVGYKISSFAKIIFIQQRTFTPSGTSTNQTLVETQFSF